MTNMHESFNESIDFDSDGYVCTDARLGHYICCGQKIDPDFVCWELTEGGSTNTSCTTKEEIG